jgi:hypothetical protein
MLEKLKQNSKHIVIVIILLAASFMVGRYTTPTKTKTVVEEKVVEKEVVKFVEVQAKTEKKDVETVVIEIISPDGTIRKETKIVDKTVLEEQKKIDLNKQTDQTRISKREETTESSSSEWMVSLMVSAKENNISEQNFGVHVQRRIIGPFYLGVYGEQNKGVGLSIGGTF